MFDPSKLNLEVDDNKDKENKENIEETNINETIVSENNSSIEKKEEVNTQDVLADLVVPEIINEEKDTEKAEKKEEIKSIEQELNDNSVINEFSYNKPEIKEEEIKEETNNTDDENKIIYDININQIKDIFYLLVDKEYDFVTFEPNESNVKIEFRKNKVIIDTKFIKFPTYSNILIKAKTSTNLKVDENSKTQEWFWEINLRNKNYKIISKTVPWDIGEKLFLKLNFQEKKVQKKVEKKMSMSQVLTFLWTIAFIWLVIWWSFIWFIALNAKTIEDVKFFAWLWIDLNEINNFISQIITIIFSILLLFETIFLIIFLFKFSLTKKEFKKRKIKYWVLSAVFLIIAFSTFSAWMIIDQKIKSLPNWQEMALWEVQLFDNSKLTSEEFDKIWSQITDSSNLIWPIEVKFDLSFFTKNQEAKWVKIKKFSWTFWDWESIETPLPTIIKNFDKKWNTDIKLIITEVDIQWKVTEKEVDWIPSINLSYVVDIEEKRLNNWWKLVTFDASSLSELWKVEWYFIENLEKPEWNWDKYIIWRPIFEETIIWMYIRRNDKESEQLDKVFIIKWEEKVNIDAEIDFKRDIINDLEFTFNIKDIQNDVWSWFIEKYLWTIWDQEYSKEWDIDNPEKSSEIKHTFKTYWDKTIKVELTDSSWETKTIRKEINIPKVLKLSKSLNIYSDSKLIEDIEYNSSLHEYFINNLWIPNKMKFDARLVRADSTLYSLQKVEWDFNWDWDIDDTWRIWYYDINTEWNHNVNVKFYFVNKKISTDIIEIEENIFIETIRKEAIVDFEINKDSNYVPVTIWFDASRSQVKDSNIAKFIWDYGDWIEEERDAVVPGHKYSKAWDYEIKLTVITDDWKKYSTSKKLILKPKAQTVDIKSSMKSAPTFQWIDFTSAWSEWQITSYFWDFWDGNNSTEANPTHTYEEEWSYEVKLRIDFSNKNILEDTLKIEIYE